MRFLGLLAGEGRTKWGPAAPTPAPGPVEDEVPAAAAAPASAQTRARGETPRRELPVFAIDLDKPLAEQYAPIFAQYGAQVRELVAEVEAEMMTTVKATIGGVAYRALELSLRGLFKVLPLCYRSYIEAFADGFGVPLEKVVLMNLMYELNASCTSIVVDSPTGPTIARNLDWALPQLAPLTITIAYTRGGEPVYTSTTFPGLVGCLTGSRPGSHAVSVNFRSNAKDLYSVVESFVASVASAASGAWPVSYLVRRSLEGDSSYATARGTLVSSRTISPVFFTVCGVEPGEGCVITRDRLGPAHADWELAEHGPGAQTNMDHWSRDQDLDIAMGESLLRRETARQLVRRCAGPTPTTAELWAILETYPVGNEVTIHSTVMCPRAGTLVSSPNPWLDVDVDCHSRCCRNGCAKRRVGFPADSTLRSEHLGDSYYCAACQVIAEPLMQDTDPAELGGAGGGAEGERTG